MKQRSLADTLLRNMWRAAAAIILLLTAGCRQPADSALPASPPSQSAALVTPSLPSATPASSGYLAPAATPTTSPPPSGYPPPETNVTPAPTVSPAPSSEQTVQSTPSRVTTTETNDIFLPSVHLSLPTALPTNTPEHTSTPTGSPTPVPTLDFRALARRVQAEGDDLAYVKFGFHVTFLRDEDEAALMDSLRQLDAAGVPFFLKSASNAEPLYKAQQMVQASGVPHTLVYRSTEWDVPIYDAEPEEAAQVHWQRHRDAFPPELDPKLVWIETLNEVDKNRSVWLAQFALKTAELAMADGFRWAAFGWASGEPEPADWESPAMLAFLRMAGAHPDQIAVALHEYSYTIDEISHQYPHKVGRFQDLFLIADEHRIPRPTVLITEWGWAYDAVPVPWKAIADLQWASQLYAPYPQIKGAAIWNLGRISCCGDELSTQVRQLLAPLTQYALTSYFTVPAAPQQAAINPDLFQP